LHEDYFLRNSIKRDGLVVTRFPAQRKIIPHIATVIAAIFLAVITYNGVDTWQNIQASHLTPNQHSHKRPITKSKVTKNDYARIAKIHLFGKESGPLSKRPKQQVKNAPETRLKLKLLGVIFNGDTDDGIAIISDNKKAQKTFHKGDKVFGNATLYAIEPNRVILMRDGRHETLTLIKPDLNTVRSSSKDEGASATTSKRLIKSRINATKSSLIKSTATSPMASRPI
jgi:general secretion pathway protein C